MPSGSKKRKALKKPKPGEQARGEAPELEPSLDDCMAKEREEMEEGLEAPADVGAVGETELISDTSHLEDNEGARVEERSAPHSPINHHSDSFGEPELQAPHSIEDAAPADLSQGDPSSLLEDKGETIHGDTTSGCDSPPREMNPALNSDVDLSSVPPPAIDPGPGEESVHAPVGNETQPSESFAKDPIADAALEDVGGQSCVKDTAQEETVAAGAIDRELDVNTESPDALPIDAKSGTEEEGADESHDTQIGDEPRLGESFVKEEPMPLLPQEDAMPDIDLALPWEATRSSELLQEENEPQIKPDVECADTPAFTDDAPSFDESRLVPPEAQIVDEPDVGERSAQEDKGPTVESISQSKSPPDNEVEEDVELPDESPPMEVNLADERESLPLETQEKNESEIAAIEDLTAGVPQKDISDSITPHTDDVDRGVDQMSDEDPAAVGSSMPAGLGDGELDSTKAIDASETDTSAASDNIEPKDITPLAVVEDPSHAQSHLQELGPEEQALASSDMDVTGEAALLDTETATPGAAHTLIPNEPDSEEMDVDSNLAAHESEATDDATVVMEKDSCGNQSEMGQEMDEGHPGEDVLESKPGGVEELEIGAALSENEAGLDTAPDSVDLEHSLIRGEGESQSETNLVDFKREADLSQEDASEVEVAEAETNSEVSANLVDVQDDEVAKSFAEPDVGEKTRVEAPPDVTLEDAGTVSKAVEMGERQTNDAENEGLMETSDVNLSKEGIDGVDISQKNSTNPEEVAGEDFKPAHCTEQFNGAPSEPSEMSAGKDVDQEIDASTTDVELQEGVPPNMQELDTKVPETELDFEDSPDTKLNEAGSDETKMSQEDEIAPEHLLNVCDEHQEGAWQTREAVTGELPGVPTDDDKCRMAGVEPEAGTLVSDVEPKAEKSSDFNLGNEGELLSAEQDKLDVEDDNLQSIGVDSSAEVTDGSLDGNQGVIKAEQSDLSKDSIVNEECTDADTSVQSSVFHVDTAEINSPAKQEGDLETEQPFSPVKGDNKEALANETWEAEIKNSEETLDNEEMTNDPAMSCVPSGGFETEDVSDTLPSKLEMSPHGDQTKDLAVCEHEGTFGTPAEEVERDIEEEEAALSTAAEAGSAITDFDENPSYQQFSADFSVPDQPADVSESKESCEDLLYEGKESSEGRESDGSSPPRSPHLTGTLPSGGVEDEQDVTYGEHRKDDSQKEEIVWKAAQDLEPMKTHEDVAQGTAEAKSTPTSVSEEGNGSDEEATVTKAGDHAECQSGTVPAMVENIPKGSADVLEPELAAPKAMHPTVISDREVMTESSNGGAPHIDSGEDKHDTGPVNGWKTRDASPPVAVPVQNVERALDQEDLKGHEHKTGETNLQHRSSMLGCCGMFDVLLGKK